MESTRTFQSLKPLDDRQTRKSARLARREMLIIRGSITTRARRKADALTELQEELKNK